MRTLLSTLLILTLSFAPAVAEEKKLDLFPLAKGTKWEYELSLNGQTQDYTQEVTAVKPGAKGERAIATIGTKVGNQTIKEEVSADEKAVYRHSFQTMNLETPLTMLKYPYEAGAKRKETIKIGKDEAVANFESFKAEEVKVAAGTYTAYPVTMVMETPGGKVTSKNWYADGVGIVKQEIEFPKGKATLQLKAFSKGK